MVIMPHYDALVLTLCIKGFDVRRVLIDPGSTMNFLKLPAFKKMKLSLDVVHSAEKILSGFNSATTITLGYVVFFVKAGPVTQQVMFSIVEDLGPCNSIMWRAWLHSMKVIPLTYHQMVNCLTNARQVGLLSN